MSDYVRQPVWYPISVAFIDDSSDFLYALKGIFPDTRTNHFFSSPAEALDFVMRNGYPAAAARMAESECGEIERGYVNAIGPDVMEDETRFETVATIIVDHDMPNLTGIEFLSRLDNVACTRILLTGAAGDTQAVKAFNAGLIDYYLRKSEPNLGKKLRALLDEARRSHCMKRGRIGVHRIGAVYCKPEVMAVLDSVVSRERIVEYYWRPEQNAVLTFDADGEPGVFLAWDENDWSFQCEVVRDERGPADLEQDIQARRFIPVFWPDQTYRSGSRPAHRAPLHVVPGLPDVSYTWVRLDRSELEWQPLTFAEWSESGQLRSK